jgi:dolichol-phosphate mannosyltransferase
MKLSVIVCAYNERDTILQVLERVQAVDLDRWEREIIVVDNHSTDGTRELLQTLDMPNLHVIYQPRNMGKGTSIRTAIDHLSGDYAIIQDADLEYDPADQPRLLAEVERGALAVFGSRTLDGQVRYEYAHAYWGVRLLTFMTNLLFGGSLTDVATATKMVRADVLKALNLTGSGFDLDFELVEVPINYRPRTYAQGKKIRAKDGLHALAVMLRDRLGLTRIWKRGQKPVNLPARAAPAE